jgi:hypothetical protein
MFISTPFYWMNFALCATHGVTFLLWLYEWYGANENKPDLAMKTYKPSPEKFNMSRDSAVGIATGYELDDRGLSLSPGRAKNFVFSTSSRLALGPTQPPIQ